MRPFESLTVFLLATNETDLLRETVKGVLKNCPDEDLERIIIFLKSEDCPSAYEARAIIEEKISDKVEMCVQPSTNAYKSFGEIPKLCKSSHFVIMASDGEMAPETLKDFISISKQKPYSIICGAKWNRESVVEGHTFHSKVGSRFLDRFASVVFGVKATDLFSIFQIYPIQLYKDMNFRNPKSFVYEYTLKPLRFGVEYIEIPTVYRREKDRKNSVTFLTLVITAVNYCYNVLRIRFIPKKYL